METYSIDDQHGNEICAGIRNLGQAQEIAHREANRRNESVWVYGADIGGDDEGLEIIPE